MILFLDTETTGINKAIDRIVQVAWVVADNDGSVVHKKSFIIKPDGFYIPDRASLIHGITNEIAENTGDSLEDVLDELISDAEEAEVLVAHNAAFDIGFLKGEFANLGIDYPFDDLKIICTMMSSTNYCRLQKLNGMPGFKRPKLEELHFFLFNEYFDYAHDALADTEACMRCFYELVEREVIPIDLGGGAYKSSINAQHNSITKNLQLEVTDLKVDVARLSRELASYDADIERIEFLESPVGIFWLARHSDDVYWKIAVLKHPECPKEIVSEIADEMLQLLDETPGLVENELLEALLTNKLTPIEKLKLLFSESILDFNILKKMLMNPSCDAELIAEIIWFSDFEYIDDAEKHQNYSKEIYERKLIEFIKNGNTEDRLILAESNRLTTAMMEMLSKDNNSIVRAAVAKNQMCSLEILTKLIKDNSLIVRENAHSNPNYHSS